jgi:hypothetical protein
MSETEQQTTLEPEGATAPSEAQETLAGDGRPAGEAHPGEEQPTEREKEQATRYDKRVGYLRSQVTQAQRERDEIAQRLTALEAQMRQSGVQPSPEHQYQEAVRQEAARQTEEQRTQERIKAFHDAGREAFPDWLGRMGDLQAMGAIPISALLVEMEDGHRVAAALRDAPDELERITSLRGERARAIALGQFAAQLAAKPTRNVSKAPAPPRPIQGRANLQFNEQQASTEQLVEHYSRQAMERRRG